MTLTVCFFFCFLQLQNFAARAEGFWKTGFEKSRRRKNASKCNEKSNDEKIALLLELMSELNADNTESEVFFRIDHWTNGSALPCLLQHLKSDNADIVVLVLDVLRWNSEANFDYPLQDYLDDFVPLLSHHDLIVRQHAISFVERLGIANASIIEALQSLVQDDEPCVSIQAIFAIVSLKPDELTQLLPLIVEASESDDFMIQHHVLDSIELMGAHGHRLLPRITELLSQDIDNQDAAFAFWKLTGDDSPVRKIIDRLRKGDVDASPMNADWLADEIEKSIRISTRGSPSKPPARSLP